MTDLQTKALRWDRVKDRDPMKQKYAPFTQDVWNIVDEYMKKYEVEFLSELDELDAQMTLREYLDSQNTKRLNNEKLDSSQSRDSYIKVILGIIDLEEYDKRLTAIKSAKN